MKYFEYVCFQHVQGFREFALFMASQPLVSLNKALLNTYTTWKVDGATPMYWFIMAPY